MRTSTKVSAESELDRRFILLFSTWKGCFGEIQTRRIRNVNSVSPPGES